jgi:hypothetical protein
LIVVCLDIRIVDLEVSAIVPIESIRKDGLKFIVGPSTLEKEAAVQVVDFGDAVSVGLQGSCILFLDPDRFDLTVGGRRRLFQVIAIYSRLQLYILGFLSGPSLII